MRVNNNRGKFTNPLFLRLSSHMFRIFRFHLRIHCVGSFDEYSGVCAFFEPTSTCVFLVCVIFPSDHIASGQYQPEFAVLCVWKRKRAEEHEVDGFSGDWLVYDGVWLQLPVFEDWGDELVVSSVCCR